MPTKTLTEERFAVIRRAKDERREWLDTHSISLFPDDALNRATATERGIEGWAAANPKVRIVRITIAEGDTVRTL